MIAPRPAPASHRALLATLSSLTLTALLAAPGGAAVIAVEPHPAPPGFERTAYISAQEGIHPCVDWSFDQRHGDRLLIVGAAPFPGAPCPPEDQAIPIGQLPAGRFVVTAQIAATGAVFAEVTFEVDEALVHTLPEITVHPAHPAPGEPVRIGISVNNTFCDQYRFAQGVQVLGDRIRILGDRDCFWNPEQPDWVAGTTIELPGLTAGTKELEFIVFGHLFARMAFNVEEPAQSLLLRDRFDVQLTWRDAGGAVHEAHPERLTAESGQFWFFRPSNTEMTVKILDGRGVNGHFWVFAASMTTLPYTLTVTDRLGSHCDLPGPPPECPHRFYEGPAGENRNVIDTRAFAGDD